MRWGLPAGHRPLYLHGNIDRSSTQAVTRTQSFLARCVTLILM
jgi:hypothetical protein